MDQLQQAREIIDQVDEQMAKLFQKRMQAVEQVVAYKKAHGLPVLDSGREQQVIAKNTARLEQKELVPYYQELLKFEMQLSREYQKSLLRLQGPVGYPGTLGAFSHIACSRIFKGKESRAYVTFEEVFQALEGGEISYGVIPFENSFTGEVGEVLDLLLKYNCHIQELYDLKIEQTLLGVPGARLEEIRQVYSHHQAISQCQTYLKEHSLQAVSYPNTALAAKFVSEQGDRTLAAIASPETAEIYNLQVLAPRINTSAENTTRFIVLGQEMPQRGNRFNLLFTVSHQAGQLAKVMQIIGEMGFNLESIKSRSLKEIPWQYYFYVEIVGNLQEERSQQLLHVLRQTCTMVKVLGTYTLD